MAFREGEERISILKPLDQYDFFWSLFTKIEIFM